MASAFEARLHSLILNHGPQPLPNHVLAVTRLVRDKLGPADLDPATVTDAQMLAALHEVHEKDGKHFSGTQPAPSTQKRQSPAQSGYDKITQANERSTQKEATRDRMGVEKHLAEWSKTKADDARFQRMSTAMKLDAYEVERQAFLDGRR